MRGDTSDLDRKLTDAERAILRLNSGALKLDNSLKGTHLSTGRLGNQFANLAGHIGRVHPIVGNLANVLGDFAIGAGMTVGILAGVAAIAVAYDKLTESTRKAKEEQDKLIKSLQDAIHLKGLGPGGETVDQVKAAKDRAAALKTQIATLEAMIVKDAQDADVLASNVVLQNKINNLYTERQNALNLVAGGEGIIKEKIEATLPKIEEMKFGFNELRKAAEQVNAEALKEKKDWWKGYIDRTNEALTLTQQLNNEINATRPSQLEAIKTLLIPSASAPEVSVPNISAPFEGLDDKAKDQLRQLGILTDKNDKNANMVRDAIWGSATALANSIVSALNIGGGGKGSNLGGALGGTAGFAGGFVIGNVIAPGVGGPVGGAIGSTIGNVIGSLVGGLFDHEKSQEQIWKEQYQLEQQHKAWLKANTAAIEHLTNTLLNAPQGFKIAQLRYDATDIPALGSAARRYASRGGRNPLLVGT